MWNRENEEEPRFITTVDEHVVIVIYADEYSSVQFSVRAGATREWGDRSENEMNTLTKNNTPSYQQKQSHVSRDI